MKIKLLKFKSVKSTNNVALRLIRKNNTKPTIITSERQTKGRGTMGKRWVSQKGNLFFSIFFEIKQKKINFKHFALLNAYLMQSVIKKEFSKKVAIKWPNDILFKKKKICGILQEIACYKKKNFLIVGIGLNTNSEPKNRDFLTTSIKSIMNKNINNNKLLNKIKREYEIFLLKIQDHSYLKLKKYINNL
jgi:BirA family biotin operon repressor/biotin-[acetyl-CoA-carboxylase] ligase